MNFASQLDFNIRMIPSAKQHALAWRMRRDTLRAHSERGHDAITGARRAPKVLARWNSEISARAAATWPLPDGEPCFRVRG